MTPATSIINHSKVTAESTDHNPTELRQKAKTESPKV